ncbi:MAG: hypothetical protein JG777_1468 [Clostridia bacterium]|nr:hypothetical protein [Clostridia bacterium]
MKQRKDSKELSQKNGLMIPVSHKNVNINDGFWTQVLDTIHRFSEKCGDPIPMGCIK